MSVLDNLFLAQEAFERSEPMTLGNPVDAQLDKEGILATDESSTIDLPDDLLGGAHACIMGRTGTGKSVIANLLGGGLRKKGIGSTLIDRHRATADRTAIRIAKEYRETKDPQLLEKVHYLRPGINQTFRLNSRNVDLSGIDPGCHELAREAFNETEADNQIASMLRNYTGSDRDVMTRLLRNLRNVEQAVNTTLPDGRRLSRGDWRVVLDVNHPDHTAVRDLLTGHLSDDVLADFHKLEAMKEHLRDQYTDSAYNQYRRVMPALVEASYSEPEGVAFDFDRAVAENHTTLVALDESEFGSAEATSVFGDDLLKRFRNACARRGARKDASWHVLMLEECGLLVADDLPEFLDTMRKFRCSVWFIGQSINTFRKGEINMMEDLQQHCGFFMTGQQRGNETLQVLAPYFAAPSLNLEEGTEEFDRPDPDGDEILELRSFGRGGTVSVTKGTTQTHSDATGGGFSISQSESEADAHSKVLSRSRAKMKNVTDASSEGVSSGISSGVGESAGSSPIMIDGVISMIPTGGTSVTQGEFAGFSSSNSHAESRGLSEAETEANGFTSILSRVFGISASKHWVQADSTGVSNSVTVGGTWSESINQQLVQRTRVEVRPTGRPRWDLSFQLARMEQLLSILPPRHMALRARINGRDQTVLFRTKFFADLDADPVGDAELLEEFLLQDLYPTKPYMFKPKSVRQSRRERLSRFLGRTPASHGGENSKANFDPDSPFTN